MNCPKCKHGESQVVDSRDIQDGVRRRRECLSCHFRYTTYERTENPTVLVLKKDGSKQRFSADKVRRGVETACKNRPVTCLQIDAVVSEVEYRVYFSGKEEISSHEIGEFVRELLKELDDIAYIRFVSVYQAFSNIDQFTNTISTLS